MPGVFISVILSAIILAAHFLRSGPGIFVLASLALIPLLFVRRPVISRVLQLALWAGAAVMFWTGLSIARERIDSSNPRVIPPLIIMSAVGLFMVVAGLAVRGTSARRWFHVDGATPPSLPDAPAAPGSPG